MFNGFKVVRQKRQGPRFDPELVGLVASLVMKIIGQTVKGRLLRAVLAGGVAATTAYLDPSQLPSFSSESEQASPAPVREATPLRNVCDADHLDWLRTDLGR